MNRPGKRVAVPAMCAARLRTRARRQRSHKGTPILSLVSTTLEQSPCRGFDTMQSRVPCRQDATNAYKHHIQLITILLLQCGDMHNLHFFIMFF